jgi:hypothetical protein
MILQHQKRSLTRSPASSHSYPPSTSASSCKVRQSLDMTSLLKFPQGRWHRRHPQPSRSTRMVRQASHEDQAATVGMTSVGRVFINHQDLTTANSGMTSATHSIDQSSTFRGMMARPTRCPSSIIVRLTLEAPARWWRKTSGWHHCIWTVLPQSGCVGTGIWHVIMGSFHRVC